MLLEKYGVNNINEPINNVTENVTENRLNFILEAIVKNNRITTTLLAKNINVSRMTIARDIETLKQQGKLQRIGPDKGGYWQVIQEK